MVMQQIRLEWLNVTLYRPCLVFFLNCNFTCELLKMRVCKQRKNLFTCLPWKNDRRYEWVDLIYLFIYIYIFPPFDSVSTVFYLRTKTFKGPASKSDCNMGNRTQHKWKRWISELVLGWRKRIAPCLVKLQHADDKIRSQWLENSITTGAADS